MPGGTVMGIEMIPSAPYAAGDAGHARSHRHGGRRPAIHAFAAIGTERRGWHAFAHHDGEARPVAPIARDDGEAQPVPPFFLSPLQECRP